MSNSYLALSLGLTPPLIYFACLHIRTFVFFDWIPPSQDVAAFLYELEPFVVQPPDGVVDPFPLLSLQIAALTFLAIAASSFLHPLLQHPVLMLAFVLENVEGLKYGPSYSMLQHAE